MRRVQAARNDNGGVDDDEPSAAVLFAIVWDALAQVLGTAAVAAIVRRAARRAEAENPELVQLVVLRESLDYRYTLPGAWSQKTERAPVALRALTVEIGRLLTELTGTVVIRRLEEIPELRACRFVWRAEEAN